MGHQLTCTVTASYALANVTTSATSAPVTVLAQSAGPTGAAGPVGAPGPMGVAGAAGAAGPIAPSATGAGGATGSRGPAGKVELVTCTVRTHRVRGHKKKIRHCTTRMVSKPVSFRTASAAGALANALMLHQGSAPRTPEGRAGQPRR